MQMYIHYELSFTLPEVFLESDEAAELNEPDLYKEKNKKCGFVLNNVR